MGDVIFLVLGCFGRRDNNFVSCAGVENRILKVTTALEHYNEAMDYFDACRLFDRPMFEMQAIRHFIFHMQDRFDQLGAGKRLWSESDFTLYQKFLIDHRLCGLYVKLILVDSEEEVEQQTEEEKSVFIESKPFSKDPTPIDEAHKLRLIRGRR
jgi:hypothetical protein